MTYQKVEGKKVSRQVPIVEGNALICFVQYHVYLGTF